MNNDTFLIEEKDFELAKDICRYIDNTELRERAAANALAAKIAAKYFEDFNADTSSGLHNASQVLENIEISDIYINGSYIDVRLYFNNNDLSIPKSHFEENIFPTAYMFIKLNSELSGGTVTGFITPSSVKKNGNGEYYAVNESELVSFYNIEPMLVTIEPLNLPQEFNSMIFEYLDGTLKDTAGFYKILIQSPEARQELLNAAKVQNVFNFVSIQPSEAEETAQQPAGQEDTSLETSLAADLDEAGILTDIAPEESLDGLEISLAGDYDLDEALSGGEISELIEEESDIEAASFDEEISDNLEHKEVDNPVYEELPENSDIETAQQPVENNIEQSTEDAVGMVSGVSEKEETNSAFEYTTVTTPGISNYETKVSEGTELTAEDLENAPEPPEMQKDENVQIDTLFNQNGEGDYVINNNVASKKSGGLIIISVIGVIAAASALGWYGYTKFAQPQLPDIAAVPEENIAVQVKETAPSGDAMPVETVENKPKTDFSNEGTSVSIPAIEQNLDASILISNLSVNWEVPSGYINNAAAKRYFTKLGKIIQLNLKTELLLLSKPPITNRIALELEYNKSSQKFDIKGITASSGEKAVDKVITDTVKKVLNINLNMNISSFGSIQGNPVLIINL